MTKSFTIITIIRTIYFIFVQIICHHYTILAPLVKVINKFIILNSDKQTMVAKNIVVIRVPIIMFAFTIIMVDFQ